MAGSRADMPFEHMSDGVGSVDLTAVERLAVVRTTVAVVGHWRGRRGGCPAMRWAAR